jgi:D-alanyl-D-alanine carboxypeptidase (penicillin-binding protein 5/6)
MPRLLWLGLLGLPLAAVAENGVAVDARAYWLGVNGQVLAQQAADQSVPPASLTKLMTALLAVEHGRLDGTVRISRRASRETGTRLGIRAGDRMLAAQLLAAALIRSANDACRALAEHVAGSEARFVARMNARARELGMKRTRFRNACGHDHPDHRSTAGDLARLAEAALSRHEIAAVTAQVEAVIHDQGGKIYPVENTNALLGRYPGVIGGKTGYTPKAGKCVIALAERGNRRVLLVLLGAPDRWWTAAGLLDRAFGDIVPAGA